MDAALDCGFPLERDADYVLFEYACHEANYAVANIPSGVRPAGRRGGPYPSPGAGATPSRR